MIMDSWERWIYRTIQLIKLDVGGATFGREIDKMYIRVTRALKLIRKMQLMANVIGSS